MQKGIIPFLLASIIVLLLLLTITKKWIKYRNNYNIILFNEQFNGVIKLF